MHGAADLGTLDQAGARQYVEMLDHRRQRHVEAPGDLRHRQLAVVCEPVENRAPRRVGQRGKRPIELDIAKVNHMVKYRSGRCGRQDGTLHNRVHETRRKLVRRRVNGHVSTQEVQAASFAAEKPISGADRDRANDFESAHGLEPKKALSSEQSECARIAFLRRSAKVRNCAAQFAVSSRRGSWLIPRSPTDPVFQMPQQRRKRFYRRLAPWLREETGGRAAALPPPYECRGQRWPIHF